MAEFVIHVGSLSATGRRPNNEDSYVCDAQRHVFLVADGMGGHSGGAMAAEQVLHNAERNFESYSPNQQAPREFLKSVVDAGLL